LKLYTTFTINYQGNSKLGKRGPRPKFSDIACPNEECERYGITDQGNVVGNGTYKTKSGRVRKYICRTCDKVFCDRSNTMFYDLRTSKDKVVLALKLVTKGMSQRSTAEVLDVCPQSISTWISRASDQSEAVTAVYLKDLKVSKVEMDELWTFAGKKESQKMKNLKTTARGSG
jgi:transposase-like protein